MIVLSELSYRKCASVTKSPIRLIDTEIADTAVDVTINDCRR